MSPNDDPLAPFHPLVRAWFAERVGTPTEVQRLAWPRIAAGAHVLAAAPTGSGKTLAAFLWAIDRLLTGAWEPGAIRVLYVSPLRALNNDVRRNLLAPLEELSRRFAAAGSAPPEVRVQVRSGDTPPDERRRMLRKPPEILITTPESLNILLTARGSRTLFDGLETVILDEIHALAATKRGAHLVTAVERLALAAGEFQRIALSATVEPKERIAEWVGGWELLTPAVGNEEPHYRRRPVEVVQSGAERRYELSVAYRAPGGPDADGETSSPWPMVVSEVRRSLAANRSTLVFGNSRRTVEKLTRLVNEGEREPPAWAHHGSLSREVREVVEERLKRGELRGIVATNSLELGIDIGALDEVLLVTTPPSVASAVQRLGRAGHQVGGVSRGRFLPLHARDLLDSAVVARAVQAGEVEPLQPVEGALDVLAQVIVSMTAGETWDVPALLSALRCAAPYHGLTRGQLDDVLEMLDGRHHGRVVPDLRPLVSLDAVEGTVRARSGAERVLYRSGGTIPDRGYFHLRRAGTGAKIGELDEEFVWERKLGDAFTLGVQGWRIEQITHNDVLVSPAAGPGAMAPFWRADGRDRGAFLSERIAAFLAGAEAQLDDPSLPERLVNEHRLTPAAASALVDLLRAQHRATGALPGAGRVVAETLVEGLAADGVAAAGAAHLLGRAGEPAVLDRAPGGLAPAARHAPRADGRRRRDRRRHPGRHPRPLALRAGGARAAGEPAARGAGRDRLLRRPLPRSGRDGAAAAAAGVRAAHAALVHAAAVQAAARPRRAAAGLSAGRRGLARDAGRPLRPAAVARAAGRAAGRDDRGARGDDPRALAVRGRRRLAAHERPDVPRRHAGEPGRGAGGGPAARAGPLLGAAPPRAARAGRRVRAQGPAPLAGLRAGRRARAARLAA